MYMTFFFCGSVAVSETWVFRIPGVFGGKSGPYSTIFLWLGFPFGSQKQGQNTPKLPLFEFLVTRAFSGGTINKNWRCCITSQYTVHSTQYTVHSTQYTVHSTQYTVHSTQYTVHSTQYTVHSTQYTVHSIHSTQYTVHSGGKGVSAGGENFIWGFVLQGEKCLFCVVSFHPSSRAPHSVKKTVLKSLSYPSALFFLP